jgi:hypothetical protein
LLKSMEGQDRRAGWAHPALPKWGATSFLGLENIAFFFFKYSTNNNDKK